MDGVWRPELASEAAFGFLKGPVDIRRIDPPAGVDILDQLTDLLALLEEEVLGRTLRLTS